MLHYLETGNNISPSFRWFSTDLLQKNHSYLDLLLYVSNNKVAFSVFDDINRAILGLCEYDITTTSEKKLSDYVEMIIMSEPIAASKFRTTKICFLSPKNTLIPSDVFDSKSVNVYFDWVTDLEEKELLFYDFIKPIDSFNVFGIHKKLFKRLNELFVSPKIFDFNTTMISNTLRENRGTRDKKLYVAKEDNQLFIFFVEYGKLLFSNRFPVQTPEDITYYILATFEQLQQNTSNTTVVLSGEFNNDETLVLLQQYLENVQLSEYPKGLYFPENLNEAGIHRYFHLYSLALCE